MYVVKVLHHPDVVIPKSEVVIDLNRWNRLHLIFHRTFVQGILEFFGISGYDVTPYNQVSFIVTAVPPRPISPKMAMELIKKANEISYGDALTNVLFDDSGRVIAILRVYVRAFVLDKYDPRKPSDWPEIAENVKGIELEYEGRGINAIKLWKVKQRLERGDPAFFRELQRWEVTEKGLSRLKEYIDVLNLLADDFVTAMLNILARPEELDEIWLAEWVYDVFELGEEDFPFQ